MRELLEKIHDLAALVTAAPQVRRFMRAFDPTEDLAKRLSELMGQLSMLRLSPLLVGVRLQKLSVLDELIQDDRDEEWFENAMQVGTSLQIVVEFLRSRMPGYPILRVPHRKKGSPYLLETNPLFVHHFPWERTMSGLGVQLKDGTELGHLFESEEGLGAALNSLVAGVRSRPSWRRFEEASRALEAADLEELGELGKEFRAQTEADVVEREAGDFLMAGFDYRCAVLEEMVESTEGRSFEYLRAFEEADELVTLVAATLQVLVMSPGLSTLDMARLDLGEGLESIPFQGLTALEDFIEPGEPQMIEAPGGREGLIYPTTLNMSLDEGGETRLEGSFFAFD